MRLAIPFCLSLVLGLGVVVLGDDGKTGKKSDGGRRRSRKRLGRALVGMLRPKKEGDRQEERR